MKVTKNLDAKWDILDAIWGMSGYPVFSGGEPEYRISEIISGYSATYFKKTGKTRASITSVKSSLRRLVRDNFLKKRKVEGILYYSLSTRFFKRILEHKNVMAFPEVVKRGVKKLEVNYKNTQV